MESTLSTIIKAIFHDINDRLGIFFWLETRHFASCNFNNFFWFRSTLGIVLKPSRIGFLMEDYLMHPHYNNLVHGSTSGWDQSECPTKIRLEIEASPLANKEENYHGYYHGVLRYWSLTPNDLACNDLGESGKYTKKGSRINSLLISWDEAPETLWSEV